MSQVERVIEAARSFRGITQVDFLLPDVVDGGPPITRLAARLLEADRMGYSFECLGRRDRCKVWRLLDVEQTIDPPLPPGVPSEPPQGLPVDGLLDTDMLFGVPRAKPSGSIYDPFQDAA
jgi:hypothetical protein